MASLSLLSAIFFIFILDFSTQTTPISPSISFQAKADSYVLAIEWQYSYCLSLKCRIMPDPNFTIHGLFGMNAQGKPDPCTGTAPAFDKTKSKELEAELHQYWPALDGDDWKFWKKEWLKHGWCNFPDEYSFFSTVLCRRKQLDSKIRYHYTLQESEPMPILAALRLNGITLGGDYPIYQFRDSFKRLFGTSPPPSPLDGDCVTAPKASKVQLLELHFCYPKSSLDLIPCKGKKPFPHCGGGTVRFPDIKGVEDI